MNRRRGGLTRIGRFGWKSQHARLHSFSADAYLNEIGITSQYKLLTQTQKNQLIAFLNSL